MKSRALLSGIAAVVMTLATTVVVAPAAHADLTTPGTYNTVVSQRILDTRRGLGAPEAQVPARGSLTIDATGTIADGVAVGAVVLNVTVVTPKASGYLTAYAGGTVRPFFSNLNFRTNQNVPNLVVTPVSDTGTVTLYNGSPGAIDLLVDIHGYYLGGENTGEPGTLVPLAGQRVLDTRNAIGAPTARVPAKGTVTFQVAGLRGIPADAGSVVANVTAVRAGARGYVTAFQGDPKPFVSTVNFVAKEDRANLTLIALADDGTLSLYNGSVASVDLVVDVTGYFVGGGLSAADGTFVSGTPFRIFNSRAVGGEPAGALTISKIQVFPADEPAFDFIKSVVVNVTAADPELSGFLTTWDGTTPLPSVSSSNFRNGRDVAGSVVVPVNPDGTISIYNGSYGNVDLLVDLTGLIFALPEDIPQNERGVTPRSAPDQVAKALAALQKQSASPASTPVSVTTR